jgi:hypothetical protein
MITITGKNGIKATILADSINKQGNRFTTMEIEYPRLVLAELNTHRMMSKNSFSSRAVPFAKMLEQLTGEPVRFGANQGGMQDKGEDYDEVIDIGPSMGLSRPFTALPKTAWAHAKEIAISIASAFFKAGYHKQVYNRLLEPYQMMKTVISATEWDNFFWLRDDDAADPTLRELARVMREAREASKPEMLKTGEWHLPYIDVWRDKDGNRCHGIDAEAEIHVTLEQAIKVSCARCAAVSYRNEGYGLEKSIEVYDRLVGSDKKHASAFEHCATPVREYGFYDGVFGKYESNKAFVPFTWEEGITHVDRQGNLWSGNLKGFIQYRKLIPGENCETE